MVEGALVDVVVVLEDAPAVAIDHGTAAIAIETTTVASAATDLRADARR